MLIACVSRQVLGDRIKVVAVDVLYRARRAIVGLLTPVSVLIGCAGLLVGIPDCWISCALL